MKILQQKKVMDANLFSVDTLDLVFENKTQATWHTITMKYDSVFVVPMAEDSQLYLISQYRPVLKKRQLEVPAGFINAGESPLAAAKRELREETGFTATDWKALQPVQLTSSVVRSQIFVFLAKELVSGETEREPSEEISVIKMPIQDVIEKIVSGEIADGPSIIALLLVNTMLERGIV